jgi:hypothetical protein
MKSHGLRCLSFLLLTILASLAHAEITAAGRTGFALRIETLSMASPEVSYEAFLAIERWWNVAHSYGGKAENLSLSITPAGGFLERLDNGGFVKHLDLAYVNPGQEIRFIGGLGPLQPMGLYGVMTIQFEPFGNGSKTIMTYTVSGFSSQGLETLAPVVDKVQSGQMQRHAAYADVLWIERVKERTEAEDAAREQPDETS